MDVRIDTRRKNTRETEEGKQEDERRNEGHCEGREGGIQSMDNTKPTFISEAVGKTTAPPPTDRPRTNRSVTQSAYARWEWEPAARQSVQKCLTFCVALPPSLGLRKRKGEVDDCGCCCIRNTHSLNRANQEGGEQDRKWREGSVRDNQDDMRKQPQPLFSYVLILLVLN